MSEPKTPKPWEYIDPDGKTVTGYALDGHVYQDEAATIPVPVGSLVPTADGNYYRMTPYGGLLWSSKKQYADDGSWIPQGNQWYRQAQDLNYAIQNRKAFAYDPGADPYYQSARDQLLGGARQAMDDSLARAAGLTGGYGSSYAQSAAQGAYAKELSRLSTLLPELYDQARKSYDAETDALYDRLGQALGLYDVEYQSYLDRLSRADKAQTQAWQQEKWAAEQESQAAKLAWEQEKWARELAWQQEKWAEEFGWDQEKWDLEFQKELQALEQKAESQSASAAASERSYAYKMAMLALQQGLTVSDRLLEQAGIDKAYAETLRRYYAAHR